MRAVTELPQGYALYDRINLQKDKRAALKVNLAGAAVFVALFFLGHFAFYPFGSIVSGDSTVTSDLLKLVAVVGGYLAYIILHELTHAAVMKYYGAVKIRFGFTGLYAYAGSEVDYFGKIPYRVIAMAPFVVWTLLLTIPLFLVPVDWFWVFYFVQIGNFAGCVGDFYVTLRLWNAPADILIRDTGVEMFIYSKQK